MARLLAGLFIFLVMLNQNVYVVLAVDIDEKFFNYIDEKKWEKAEKIAKQSSNKILLRIAFLERFLNQNYDNRDVLEIMKFLKKNYHWPETWKIKNNVESYLNKENNSSLSITWFRKHKPGTSNGYKAYALAASKYIKDQNKLKKIIKEGWVYGVFDKLESKNYLKKYNKFLNESDHIKKMDELFWIGNSKNINQVLPLISPLISRGYAKSFKLGASGLKDKKVFKDVFKTIPKEYNISGIIYQYLKSQKRTRPTIQSLQLFKKINNRNHADRCFNLLMYYTRECIDYKDFSLAYKMISEYSNRKRIYASEAEWLSGWIALRFLDKPKKAIGHFQKFISIVSTPVSLSRGLYWQARAHEEDGQIEKALKMYKKASQYGYSFYGQLASIELGEQKIITPDTSYADLNNKKNKSDKEDISGKESEIVEAAKLFFKYGYPERGFTYLRSVVKKLNAHKILKLTDFIKSTGNQHYATKLAKLASQRHIFIKKHLFPTIYKNILGSSSVESALTYSIIKQESMFDQYAISEDNAMGLMQLIKSTACITASSVKVKCSVKRLTHDIKYNISLGNQHLADLLKERKGSYILTIASYNTASHNVNRWMKLFGRIDEQKDFRGVIDWLELVPFYETRNYLQRVLENIQVYRSILNKNNKLELKRDLVRSTKLSK